MRELDLRMMDDYHIPKDTVVAQMSGYGSVAAIIKSLERSDVKHVLPVVSFSGIEVNDIENPWQLYYYNLLVDTVSKIHGSSDSILEPVAFSIPDIWKLVAGRFTHILSSRFGFYSPCYACKMYFLVCHIPVAIKLGKKIIIDDRVKDGKVNTILPHEYGRMLASHFGIETISYNKEETKDIVNGFTEEDTERKNIKCAFSGSSQMLDGSDEEKMITRYYDEYLYPISLKITQFIADNDGISREEIRKILHQEVDNGKS